MTYAIRRMTCDTWNMTYDAGLERRAGRDIRQGLGHAPRLLGLLVALGAELLAHAHAAAGELGEGAQPGALLQGAVEPRLLLLERGGDAVGRTRELLVKGRVEAVEAEQVGRLRQPRARRPARRRQAQRLQARSVPEHRA